jgi:hypothetical protein
VDTIAEINTLASLANAIQTQAAGGTPTPLLTEVNLASLGLTGVTPDNLRAVLNAIASQPDSGTDTDSLSKLQGVIGSAVTAYQRALTAIQNAAQNNNATDANPTAAQYADLGVSGVTAQNLGAMNSALNDPDITGLQANTAAKVQTLVDAYRVILSTAEGAPNNSTDPTQAHYEAIGVNGINLPEELNLLGEVIDSKTTADVDTLPKVQALADAVQAVMAATATQSQLAALGITGVTPANLSTVQAALAAAVDATELNTQAGVQSVIDNATNALGVIQAAAQNNTADASTPGLALYAAVGVTGVDANNLASINDALNDADVTGSQADTAAKVQAIVDGFNAILTNADGTANNAANPTQCGRSANTGRCRASRDER